MTADETVLSLTDDQRRDVMKAPDEVTAMLRLKALGWGSKRIGNRMRAQDGAPLVGWRLSGTDSYYAQIGRQRMSWCGGWHGPAALLPAEISCGNGGSVFGLGRVASERRSLEFIKGQR